MKKATLILFSLLLSSCATIGPEHENLSRQIEAGIDKQELYYGRLIDRFEKESKERIEERMRFIEGPVIMKHAIKGSDFDKNICRKEGDMDKAMELLEFTIAASRSYERRKLKYLKALDELVSKLRVGAREQYALMRQAASSLTTGLKAYNRGKETRRQVMKRLGAPMDHVDAINQASDKMNSIIEDGERKFSESVGLEDK